ncbi:hypothetical protein BJ085DRAFT_36060 [Dimargaris cristalligena]|uniref:Bacteriophage T5 Orf172 DNA-binding domain-containing protein n=1 Tax=Dimargaris cristalligena TaxID=215637 RepID=A0A4P9ZXA6_9FUNG|nr:hypothetical protein BJ085DRAFT_36060 [Dimargaris cristalligena]|eukprot:RKP37998.1 hypothetical protein BJ085DRAFT_36060 [Dimargaris cristalligena]
MNALRDSLPRTDPEEGDDEKLNRQRGSPSAGSKDRLKKIGQYLHTGWDLVQAHRTNGQAPPSPSPSSKLSTPAPRPDFSDALTNLDLVPNTAHMASSTDDTRPLFFQAKRFQLPRFGDLLKTERPLYGEVRAAPKAGKFSVQCQALTKNGAGKHCSNRVTVDQDPRTNDWSDWGPAQLFCRLHQDASRLSDQIHIDISEGKFHGLVDPNLSVATKRALHAELERPPTQGDRPGFIYVYQLVTHEKPQGKFGVLSPDVTLKLKIGRSVDVERRMKQWKGQCGYELYMLEFFPAPVDQNSMNPPDGGSHSSPTSGSSPSSSSFKNLLASWSRKLQNKLVVVPNTKMSFSIPFLHTLPTALRDSLMSTVANSQLASQQAILPSPSRGVGRSGGSPRWRGSIESDDFTGDGYDSDGDDSGSRSTSTDSPRKSTSTSPTLANLPRCAYANKAERLIHLQLQNCRVEQTACATCRRIHKEWFEIKVSRSAFIGLDSEAGQDVSGWRLDPKVWFNLPIRQVVVHWLKYLQDQHGLV